MDWKQQIESELKQATKDYAINSALKSLIKKLLEGDTEFVLVFSSGRGQFSNIRLKEKPKPEFLRIAAKHSNINVVKSLIKIGRLY